MGIVMGLEEWSIKKWCTYGDFPSSPVVKNPPSNAGDVGSIPGWGTKIPHASGQISLSTATTDPCSTIKTQHSQK